MGFCFPGLDAKGSDLPPRRECAELWRERVFALMPNLELVLLVGQYAQKWRLGPRIVGKSLSETVARWRDIYQSTDHPRLMPLPHPSWRNNAWLKRNLWFETELLPVCAGRGRPDRRVGRATPASTILKPSGTDVV